MVKFLPSASGNIPEHILGFSKKLLWEVAMVDPKPLVLSLLLTGKSPWCKLFNWQISPNDIHNKITWFWQLSARTNFYGVWTHISQSSLHSGFVRTRKNIVGSLGRRGPESCAQVRRMSSIHSEGGAAWGLISQTFNTTLHWPIHVKLVISVISVTVAPRARK